MLIAMILFSSVACSSTKYNVVEAWDYDNVSGAEHKMEFDTNSKKYEKAISPVNKKMNFNNKEYELYYVNSKKGYLYEDDIDFYEYIEKGTNISIGINNKTGRIDSFSWMSINYLESKSNVNELNRDECLNIAQKYLADFVDDALEYTLINERYLEMPTYQAVYDFEFSRVIDGMKTSDMAYIGITVYGDIITHLFKNLGEMRNETLPNDDDLNTIYNNINEKISVIYNNVSEKFEISYDISEVVFVKLENGKRAMIFDIDVDLLNKNDSSLHFGEFTKLLVYLE